MTLFSVDEEVVAGSDAVPRVSSDDTSPTQKPMITEVISPRTKRLPVAVPTLFNSKLLVNI
jgi:hypothetical protein